MIEQVNTSSFKPREKANFFNNCKHLSPWREDFHSQDFPEIQVVTCFLQRNNKILVLQRKKKDEQYQLWGIPGGKLYPSELNLHGLGREIFEETGAVLPESSFTYLDSTVSKTSTDGCYGLHLYYAKFPDNDSLPIIDPNEHLSHKWVSLDEFINLNLLHAQGEAFLLVREQLLKHTQGMGKHGLEKN